MNQADGNSYKLAYLPVWKGLLQKLYSFLSLFAYITSDSEFKIHLAQKH